MTVSPKGFASSLRAPQGSTHARVMGVGGYRPERIVPNSEIVDLIDSSDEWIRERSGIIERRWAGAHETIVEMSAQASEPALAMAGITAQDIDCIIVATVSHPYQTPAVAPLLAVRLGSGAAAAFDISAACAGYCHGIAMAADMVRGGTARHVLVVGVERLSDFTDSWIEVHERDLGWPAIIMQGQSVFRWAVWGMAPVARKALDAAGITADQLDAFIPHQANVRIIDAMVKQLKLPESVVVARDIAYTGNTSAASIPLATERMLREGEIPSGGLALQIGFGAGLVYAAQVIVLP